MPEPIRESIIDEKRVRRIALEYFDRDACPLPRQGYTYGDNPFAKYVDEPLSLAGVKFFPITKLRKSDLFPNSWLRIFTKSGAIYTFHIMEDPDDEENVVGIGDVYREQPYKKSLIVGYFQLPKLGKPLDFREYASFNSLKEVIEVKYLSPDELRRRIEDRVRNLFREQGDEWMRKSVTGIENSPRREELKFVTTTEVERIELGLQE